MSTLVDCRGLACPQPVVQTKKALDDTNAVTVIVDNPAARDNVSRFGVAQGCQVTINENPDGIYVHVSKGSPSSSTPGPAPQAEVQTGPAVVVIAQDQMGRGDAELGHILIRSFVHTLTEVSDQPTTVIFFNTGVRLTVSGSDVLNDLCALAARGVEILVCGTCLDFFKLKDKLGVGQVSNMYTIVETMLSAHRLVTV